MFFTIPIKLRVLFLVLNSMPILHNRWEVSGGRSMHCSDGMVFGPWNVGIVTVV
jgi:hypothetical protein